MEEPAQVKVCSKCKIEKKISNFGKDKTKSSGLRSDCKECNKDYRQTHKEQIKKRHMEYCLTHGEEIKRAIDKYNKIQKLNPEFIDTPQLWYFNKIEANAGRRNINCNLTYQELLNSNHSQNCCFCGIELKFTKTMDQASGNQNGSLDRIDSSKGYEVGNIQWSCWKCNHLKSTFSQDDFLQLCNNIAHTNPRPYLAC